MQNKCPKKYKKCKQIRCNQYWGTCLWLAGIKQWKKGNMNIIQSGEVKQENEFFSQQELACRHCNQLIVDWQFLDLVTELRRFVNIPMKVSSFYRCPVHNDQIGGTKNSAHLYGKGIDISLVNVPLSMLISQIELFGIHKFNGVGYYPDANDRIVHLDNLDRYSRWVRLNGKYYSLL